MFLYTDFFQAFSHILKDSEGISEVYVVIYLFNVF